MLSMYRKRVLVFVPNQDCGLQTSQEDRLVARPRVKRQSYLLTSRTSAQPIEDPSPLLQEVVIVGF